MLALGLAAALLAGGPPEAEGVPLFAFRDEHVIESSGLVDRGRSVLTTNDSGDDAVVYAVDVATGRTVARTTYADEVADVEALAPGADGSLWAGDIGDNRARRDEVSVYRLRPDGGDRPAQRYRLVYPDGARDAETLLVQPASQRVFVISKSVFGGTVYAAPRTLRTDRRNRLVAFARVPGLLTDGTFLPDGRHVLLRTYGSVSLYTFPGFALVGTARLPAQRSGEGISVGPGGRVLVSSEGLHAEVLQVSLPPALSPALSSALSPAPSPAPSPGQGEPAVTASPTPPPVTPAPGARAAGPPRDRGDWVGIGLVAAGLVAAAWLVARRSRVRGTRS